MEITGNHSKSEGGARKQTNFSKLALRLSPLVLIAAVGGVFGDNIMKNVRLSGLDKQAYSLVENHEKRYGNFRQLTGTYKLPDGRTAETYFCGRTFPGTFDSGTEFYLGIVVDGKKVFLSESWENFPGNNIRNLEEIDTEVSEGVWDKVHNRRFEMEFEHIRKDSDYIAKHQKEYEDLVRELAALRQ